MRTLPYWRTALVIAATLVFSTWHAIAGCAPGRFVPVSPSSPIAITAASRAPIWRSVTIGEYKDVNALRAAIDGSPCRIGLGESADEILGRPAFPYSQTRRELDLAVVSVAALGFGPEGASLHDIYSRAARIGLELCPAEVGPMLRLSYLDQPIGQSLHIAMLPVSRYDDELIDLTLLNGGAGLLLIGGDANPDLVLNGTTRFVFVRPRLDTVSGAEQPRSNGVANR